MPSVREIMMDKVNGASFIGLTTETAVTLRGGQKNPLQGRVTKVTVGSNVQVFQNKNTNAYENMVNRRLLAEGKPAFELSERTWGTREKGTPFVTHDGSEYLEVIFIKPGQSHYRVDGKVTAKEDIEGLPVTREAEQGGLNDKVIIRTYAVESILSITVDKVTHICNPKRVKALMLQAA